jgi:RHS repeat-associated protein
MEKDNEVKTIDGGSYDFGARMFDSRVGRWLSRDPKAGIYPDISPYAYALNNPIIFTDPGGDVVVDPASGKKVVKVDGQWKTIQKVNKDGTTTYGDVSDKFTKVSQPVLDVLTSSKIGNQIYEQLQNIETEVSIDTEDEYNLEALNTKGSNSEWSTKSGTQSTDSKTGLYKSQVIITPNLDKIKEQAAADGIDYEEKLLQVMSVEKDHISTKEQIDLEKNPENFDTKEGKEAIYGGLLNEAVRVGKEYRKEKGQTPDASSNYPVIRYNQAEGTDIKLEK